MKIKLIGLGQCGSFVVYDVIAFLFDQKPSKEIKVAPQSQWKRDVGKAISQASTMTTEFKIRLKTYFKGLKTPDTPKFFVIDGNSKNAVVDGFQAEDISRKLGPLQVFVESLLLSNRNNGCSLGQVGEYAFRKEREMGASSKVFTALNFGEQVEINAVIFAGGGGSGSGGVPVLNNERRNKDSLLINMMVLPPYDISDRRQAWNTGRCIMRLATLDKQTTLLLFSNLSENLTDQFNVNEYIRKLVVRLANFGYPGNVPKVATDVDRKDLQVFFSGKPAFVGMSSLDRDEPDTVQIEQLVEQALAVRRATDGLSIEIPEKYETALLKKIKSVMIVLGLPPKYAGEVNIVDIVKRKVAERLGKDLSELDCRAHSYTSLDEVELTIFLRHTTYRSNFLLDHFLNSYLKWHDGEATESEYLMQEINEEAGNDFLDDVRRALKEEAGDNHPDWLKTNFSHPIIEVK